MSSPQPVESASSLRQQAEQLVRQGNLRGARRTLQAVAKLEPASDENYFRLAHLAYVDKSYDEAIEWLRQAIAG